MSEIYTVAEVASKLRVRKNYIYEIIYRGELKAVRLSEKRFRITEDSLKEYLEKNTVQSFLKK